MSKKQSNSKLKRTRRSFSNEFKLEVAKMVTEQSFKAAEVARSLDDNENLIQR